MKISDSSVRPSSVAKPLKVLLVDDNIHDYRMMSLLVSSEAGNRYTFDWARNSEEAQEFMEKLEFDIVAVDYHLGVEIGSKVISKLSTHFPDPAYLLVTATSDADVYKEGIKAGAENFVPKGSECGLLFDRTAQYAIERKRLAKSLKITNASKDWLMSILAKDLGTPLFALNELLSTLMKEGQNMPREMLHELLETAYFTSCESITATNEMLEWGQSIQGALKPQLSMINVEENMQRAIRLLTTVANERDIYLSKSGSFDCLASCDERMLASVARNLISAAIFYTADNENLNICSKMRDSQMRITIAACGQAMTPKALEFLRSPDESKASTLTSLEKQALTCLQVSSHLLDAMGSGLIIANRSKQGVEFSFDLSLTLPSDSIG